MSLIPKNQDSFKKKNENDRKLKEGTRRLLNAKKRSSGERKIRRKAPRW